MVEAFDSKRGAQLVGLPVAIGDVRGVTSKPIPLTIAVTSIQRCGLMGAQQFCLNC
jgi:hypothetical protein